MRLDSRILAVTISLLIPLSDYAVGRSQVGGSPSPLPHQLALPQTQSYVLSAPVTRHVKAAAAPTGVAPAALEPNVFVDKKSLQNQKQGADSNALGRGRSGTLLFATPSPKPVAIQMPAALESRDSARFRLSTNTASLSPETGAKTTPHPAVQMMGREPNVAVDLAFPGETENPVPPDNQLAVGPKQIVEMNNGDITIWDKSGAFPHAPAARFPLQAQSSISGGLILPPPDHVVGDPWLIYDASSHRWIASAMIFEKGVDSSIVLAVSPPDDPAGDWTVRTLVQTTGGKLHDQPKIALTDDKLLISWTDFDQDGNYMGGVWAAFSKAAILNSNVQLAGQGLTTPDPCQPNPIPAKNQSAGNTGYILSTVFPDAESSCLGAGISNPSVSTGNDLRISVINGLAPSLKYRAFDVKIAEYSAPPDVIQKQSPTSLSGGDTRLLSAILQKGQLWAAANGSCKIQGATSARGCFRLLHLSTTWNGPNGPPKLLQDVNVAINDRDVLFPSLSADSLGNVFAAVTQVSPARYLGAAVFARVAFHSDWQLLTITQGGGELSCGDNPTRIGDYSGADRDPAAPASIWLAIEVPSAAGCNQGSSISKVSLH